MDSFEVPVRQKLECKKADVSDSAHIKHDIIKKFYLEDYLDCTISEEEPCNNKSDDTQALV